MANDTYRREPAPNAFAIGCEAGAPREPKSRNVGLDRRIPES